MMNKRFQRGNSAFGKKNRAGFTLAEVLVAILILLMVSSIVAVGIPAAKNAYQGTVAASNAEVLLSTTIKALQGKLGTASSVKTDDNDSVVFYNSDTHGQSRIYKDPTTKNIMYQENYDEGTQDNSSAPVSLVPEKAMEEDQFPTYQSVTVTEGNIVTFIGLSVIKNNTEIASAKNEGNPSGNISIRTLSSARH